MMLCNELLPAASSSNGDACLRVQGLGLGLVGWLPLKHFGQSWRRSALANCRQPPRARHIYSAGFVRFIVFPRPPLRGFVCFVCALFFKEPPPRIIIIIIIIIPAMHALLRARRSTLGLLRTSTNAASAGWRAAITADALSFFFSAASRRGRHHHPSHFRFVRLRPERVVVSLPVQQQQQQQQDPPAG